MSNRASPNNTIALLAPIVPVLEAASVNDPTPSHRAAQNLALRARVRQLKELSQPLDAIAFGGWRPQLVGNHVSEGEARETHRIGGLGILGRYTRTRLPVHKPEDAAVSESFGRELFEGGVMGREGRCIRVYPYQGEVFTPTYYSRANSERAIGSKLFVFVQLHLTPISNNLILLWTRFDGE